MGGEKARDRASVVMVKGSPPHGRGKGAGLHALLPETRITPAWAGKSSAKFPHRTSARDHPRTGGEKHNVFTLGSLVQGSPPRRRGKATLDGHVAQGHGITPAWAGKRSGGLSRRIRPENHPRVGGKKCPSCAAALSAAGSPPRGRGKVQSDPCFPFVVRITPAWAGKSSSGRGWRFLRRDHPCVGGEKGISRAL